MYHAGTALPKGNIRWIGGISDAFSAIADYAFPDDQPFG